MAPLKYQNPSPTVNNTWLGGEELLAPRSCSMEAKLFRLIVKSLSFTLRFYARSGVRERCGEAQSGLCFIKLPLATV